MNLSKQLFPAVALTLLLTVLLGVLYPLAVTGLAALLFPEQAAGSLIVRGGRVLGSRLIGQPFLGPGYFRSRPSQAGSGYDAANSNASNLAPTSKKLVQDQIGAAAAAAAADDPGRPVPVDLVTSSGSGLDPHISPAAAELQVRRVARARGRGEEEVRRLVRAHTAGRDLGLLGEPRVNVLELNLALDAAWPAAPARGTAAAGRAKGAAGGGGRAETAGVDGQAPAGGAGRAGS
jgi:K+-transporting ATPase ATPase C chain